MTFRNIHATPVYRHAGVAKWTDRKCREALAGCRHLARDSTDVLKMFGERTATAQHYFAKLEVKDFYMSGDLQSLVNDSTVFFEGGLKRLMQMAVGFLLEINL